LRSEKGISSMRLPLLGEKYEELIEEKEKRRISD
jgi:hypothetical protein